MPLSDAERKPADVENIHIMQGGGFICTGEGVHVYRIHTLRAAMRLELNGIRVKSFSVIARVKREFGLTGTRESVYAQFCAMHRLEE